MLWSCGSTRRLAENEYLLEKVVIEIDNNKIKKENLKGYLRQTPNKRILGGKFHLGVYNLANPNKTNRISEWYRRIGEEPVVYDQLLKDKSTEQFQRFLFNKGYYNAIVSDTVYFHKQKAEVNYFIESNDPFYINKIEYEVLDTGIRNLILNDTVDRVITTGSIFDSEELNNERVRIENFLNNRGYYDFNREFISFEADTSQKTNAVNLKLIVDDYSSYVPGNKGFVPHKKYYLNSIYIHTNFNRRLFIQNKDDYLANVDTVMIEEGIYAVQPQEFLLKKNILLNSNYIIPGEIFNQYNVERTHSAFTSLAIIRLVNIEFKENNIDSLNNFLDCNIYLTPQKRKSFALDTELTYSEKDFGAGGSLIFRNKNFLKGAEVLDIKVYGEMESVKNRLSSQNGDPTLQTIDRISEYGVQFNLMFPKFALPFNTSEFEKKFNPQTNFSTSYSSQSVEYWDRKIINFSYGYYWRGNKYLRHIIKPVDLYYVEFTKKPGFEERNILYYQQSFYTHTLSAISYSLMYQNQQINGIKDYINFRYNVETAGNTLTLINNYRSSSDSIGGYKFLGNIYAQYVKTDFDFRYHQILSEANKVVYRISAGLAIPYGNSSSIPIEKQYYSGGENTLRGWRNGLVGPGALDSTSYRIGADIKLEANIEYRFDMPWYLEGALFCDVGNVWFLNQNSSLFDDNETGNVVFNSSSFYKQLAVASGIGLRLDFSFLLLRFDFGFRIFDPSQPENQRFLLKDGRFNFGEHFKPNFGIDYPF